jgi:hypothetical protein
MWVSISLVVVTFSIVKLGSIAPSVPIAEIPRAAGL